MTRSRKAGKPRVRGVGEKRLNGGDVRLRASVDEGILDASEVELYAGYRADESPRAIFFEGRRIEIIEILERKRIEDRGSGRRREVFLCRLEDGSKISLENLGDGSWSLKSVAERG